MSANVLSEDKSQLAGQLLGRLLSATEPEIQGLLKQTIGWKRLVGYLLICTTY